MSQGRGAAWDPPERAVESLSAPDLPAESSSHLPETDSAGPQPASNKFDFLASPPFIKTLLLSGGAALVGLSLWLAQHERESSLGAFSWVILLVGLGLVALTSRTIEIGKPPGWLTSLLNKIGMWLAVSGWQVVCLAISPLLAWIAFQAAGDGLLMLRPVVAVAAWLLAMMLALAGGWQFRSEVWSFSPQTLVSFGLIVAIAAFTRGYNLAHIPFVLTGDEGSAGLAAVDVLNGFTNNIFRSGWFSFPALHSFVQALPIAIFGQTAQALRLASVFAGALTAGAVFLAARSMFGERAAFFAAVFLSAFHFHNHFSRIGLNNIWDGLWFTAVLGLLWLGWRNLSRRYFLLAGLALGFSQYFYVTVRALFLLIPVWILVAGIFDRARLKRSLPHLLLMGFVALAAALPLALSYSRHPEEFFAPLRRVSILGAWMANEVQMSGLPAWRILLNQVALSLQGFAHLPLRMWYQPGTPLLRLIPAILFFLGLGLLLRKPRDSRTLLFGLWLLALGIMNGFSESAPAAQRYVAAAPAVAIVLAYGLDESAALLGDLWPRYRRFITSAALAFIILLSLDELRFYFQVYTPKSDLGGENTLVANRLAHYLQGKSDEWQVAFFGAPRMGYTSIASLPYLAPHIRGYDMNRPWGSPDNPQLYGGPLAFVFLPGLNADLEAVQASYPDGELLQEKTPDGRLLYWVYEVSGDGVEPADLSGPQPMNAYPYPFESPTAIPGGYP